MTSPEEGPKTPYNDRLRCKTCQKQFTRLEHLNRHTLIHTKRKLLQCEHCSKEFLRKDALHRHVQTHKVTGPSLLQRRARACLPCATAKARCSGELPSCQRCQNRGINSCTYPNTEETHSRMDVGTPILPSPVHISDHQFMPYPSLGHMDGNSGSFSSQRIPDSGPPFNGPSMTQNAPPYWDPTVSATTNWLVNENQAYPFNPILQTPHTAQASSIQPFEQSLNSGPLYQSQSVGASRLSHSEAYVPQQVQGQQQGISIWSLLSPDSTVISPQNQDDNQHEGEYYVDGNAARFPKFKRQRLVKGSPMAFFCVEGKYSLDVKLDPAVTEASLRMQLSDHVYNGLQKAFNFVCVSGNTSPVLQSHQPSPARSNDYNQQFYSVFSSQYAVGFPPKAVFESLFGAYIEFFQPLVPVFHRTQFDKLSWQTVLAICAIGSHLIETEKICVLAPSLHEFMRRLLFLALEDASWMPVSPIERAQIKLLHTVGMLYSGRELDLHAMLLSCNELLADDLERKAGVPVPTQPDSTMALWIAWIEQESVRRTAYAVMLVDAFASIHFQRQPRFDREDVTVPLPCHEDLWEADTYNDWYRILPRCPQVGTLEIALQRLYVDKTVLPCTGEYGRVLIVQGVFRRTWEVEKYFKQPLSHWIPTAKQQPKDAVSLRSSLWLPAHPIYAQWRNSACDCFDVLHWSANATIGQAIGVEHPMVLHLHFARIVLLTPHKSVVALAKRMAGENGRKSDNVVDVDTQAIRAWASQDQYKARLAMIHAGSLFWHIRRFPVHAFYEPASLAIATLCLWAYSTFTSRPDQSTSEPGSDGLNPEPRPEADEDEPVYDIILLDRPTDDELVQQFVREGHKMRTNMNGVGDLFAKQGPERVLIEGRKLLRSLTCWAVADQWVKLLDQLIDSLKRQRQQQTD